MARPRSYLPPAGIGVAQITKRSSSLRPSRLRHELRRRRFRRPDELGFAALKLQERGWRRHVLNAVELDRPVDRIERVAGDGGPDLLAIEPRLGDGLLQDLAAHI